MAENPTTQVSKANMPLSEKQQLVGVLASKVSADAAMEKKLPEQ